MFNILNIELTSLCNKNCHVCGRRKIDKDYPELKLEYGNMDFDVLKKIKKQLPEPIMIQFHNNGEPTLYPRLKDALQLFAGHIRCFNTNGKFLLKKADDIINNLETITISTIENDPDSDEQLEIVKEFIKLKGINKPNMIIRCLGRTKHRKEYEHMGLMTVDRILHSPMGSFNYKKKTTIPETGICMEMINHPAINIKGEMSICVRFDPERKGVLGNINNQTITDIWNGEKRKQWLQQHINMKRQDVPLCSKCDFWGIPRG